MDKKSLRNNEPASGFSLSELMAVVVILAVLFLIAGPAVVSAVTSFELKRAASATSDLFYTGRMTAYNTKKPARAVINCSDRNFPCRLSVYTAVFKYDATTDETLLDSWSEIGDSIRDFSSRVTVQAKTPNTVHPSNPDRVFWAVFYPSGQVVASHSPLNLVLDSNHINSGDWEISLNQSTGHVSVQH